MATTTIQFNPNPAGAAGIQSAAHLLPATVSALELDLQDPNGDWVNPANAGGTFIFGMEYSADGVQHWDNGTTTWDGSSTWDIGGTTWDVAISNGGGQPIGSMSKDGSLPKVIVGGGESLSHLYGSPCRGFAQLQTPPNGSVTAIVVSGQAIVTS